MIASFIPSILNELDDLNVPSPTDGHFIKWDAGTSRWIASAGGSGVTVLNDLTDVTIATPALGQVLRHDGTDWKNAQLAHADLSGIGTNAHSVIDTHIADTTIHFTEASVDHGSITGLSDDDHTQYALLAGRSGGQVFTFGTGAGENGTFQSTSHATKGKILFGTSAYDEVNNRLGIGIASPTAITHINTGVSASPGFEALRITNTGAFDASYVIFPRNADTTHGIMFGHQLQEIDKNSMVGAIGPVSESINIQAGLNDSAARGKINLQASGGLVAIGTLTPEATAVLDISSTTQGVLAPRMTTTQRDAIVTPATGLLIFNTTTGKYQFYNGTVWGDVAGAGGGEANTASNVNVGGVGVFKQKAGVDLEFRGVIADSTKIAVVLDGVNNEIGIDLNEANVVHQNLSGAGTNTHGAIDTHLASTSNPHTVTKAQVSLANVTDDSQLKRADGDIFTFTEKVTPVSGDWLLIEDSAASNAKKRVQVGNLPGGGGGEANTYSSDGVGGVAVIKTKVGVDLPFKSINAGSSKITVTDDTGNSEIDIDVAEANLTLSNLGGAVTDAQVPNTITLDNITQITTRSHTSLADVGSNAHSVIDTHLAATATHGATGAVVGTTNTQTLTNKTFTDNVTTFQDNLDNTKKLQLQLSGITTATTRTLTIPDANGTLELTSHAHAINDLSDVVITAIASGEILKYDGANFINNTLSEAGIAATGHTHVLTAGATDVTALAAELNLLDLAGLSVGQVLRASGASSAAWTALLWADITKTTSSIGDITTKDHDLLSGLTDDDHTQYALLAGRSTGQSLIGGTAAGEDLTLQSTSHATKGDLIFGTSVYSEDTNSLGLRTATPNANAVMDADGQYYSQRHDYGNSTATLTVDWVNGNVQHTTLNANCTLSVSNGMTGGRYVLFLKQDATGSRTVTWWAGILWSGGTAPTLTTTASKTDIITLVFDGTNWFGAFSLNY